MTLVRQKEKESEKEVHIMNWERERASAQVNNYEGGDVVTVRKKYEKGH